ncbi:acetylglutamate kinase [Candidatus Amarolinea dominans]|uniref:acetylglutamate kinase n=1 Tax=Candidatus Amarolinea dominans TaxID=3140696 RepID=UPI003136D7B0|nr:acetylglutamate kinase [Anaerolineae bacterium]
MSTQKPVVVIKIGGNEIDDAAFLGRFVAAVQAVQADCQPVIVHGGGKEIADLHQRLQVPFEMVQGVRVTSAESLRLVEMVLSGLVNTRVVRWLVNRGVEAIGLTGVDAGLVQVTRWQPDGLDLGYVGKVTAVRVAPLQRLLAQGFVPVISPVSLGEDGQTYNVNADHVAAALAHGLQASRLVFVTNVPGVLVAGRVVRVLTIGQVEEMIGEGIITGGMVPKVRSAAEAVVAGVYQAVITDLDGLARTGGTAIVK